jgi:hypothetical protein
MKARTGTEIREAIVDVVRSVEKRMVENGGANLGLEEWERDSFVESGFNEVLRVLRVEEGLDTTEGA